jgi:hypothetical protein
VWRRAVLYVGHFWFVGPEPELETEGPWTGWFTLLAQAESPQSAEEKFHRLITRMKGRFEGFDSVLHVYAGDIIEVKELPAQAVMAHFHEDPEPGARHIYTSLPGVPPEFCVSYGLGNEANTEIEPFVSFE